MHSLLIRRYWKRTYRTISVPSRLSLSLASFSPAAQVRPRATPRSLAPKSPPQRPGCGFCNITRNISPPVSAEAPPSVWNVRCLGGESLIELRFRRSLSLPSPQALRWHRRSKPPKQRWRFFRPPHCDRWSKFLRHSSRAEQQSSRRWSFLSVLFSRRSFFRSARGSCKIDFSHSCLRFKRYSTLPNIYRGNEPWRWAVDSSGNIGRYLFV